MAYSSGHTALVAYVNQEYLNKFLAVVFAAGATVALDTFFRRLLRRDSRWAFMLGGVMAVWFLLMFTVSFPYGGGIFDPTTGEARAKYLRMSDGTIKRFPVGVNFDPETGQALLTFDKKTAAEFNKQKETRGVVAAAKKSAGERPAAGASLPWARRGPDKGASVNPRDPANAGYPLDARTQTVDSRQSSVNGRRSAAMTDD